MDEPVSILKDSFLEIVAIAIYSPFTTAGNEILAEHKKTGRMYRFSKESLLEFNTLT